ncbi:MAG: ribonuclease HII [Bacteroidota bacterium]
MKLKLKICYANHHHYESGLDEAGRGCLAGPVYAAAVILDHRNENSLLAEMLNDSKVLSEKQRYALRTVIEQEALDFAVANADNFEIDEINILNASFLAMHRCIDQLKVKPDILLVDGNRFLQYATIPHKCIIKGDGIFRSIAAASILAKTYRDDFMYEMHKKYPVYQWNQNKGYPTKEHRSNILKYGLSPLHRLTFRNGV